jgi:hypothetical protein
MMVQSSKVPVVSFKCSLVTKMLPALPDLRAVIKKYSHVISSCPPSSKVFHYWSIFAAYSLRLPSFKSFFRSFFSFFSFFFFSGRLPFLFGLAKARLNLSQS